MGLVWRREDGDEKVQVCIEVTGEGRPGAEGRVGREDLRAACRRAMEHIEAGAGEPAK